MIDLTYDINTTSLVLRTGLVGDQTWRYKAICYRKRCRFIFTIEGSGSYDENDDNWKMGVYNAKDENKAIPDGKGGANTRFFEGGVAVSLWRANFPIEKGQKNPADNLNAILIVTFQDQSEVKPSQHK